MTIATNIRYLDEAIAVQRFAFRFHLFTAAAVFIWGVVAVGLAIVGGVLGVAPLAITTVIGAGGGLSATVSTVPLGQLVKRREKLGALRFLRNEFGQLDPQTTDEQDEGVAQLAAHVRELLNKQLEG